MKLLCVIDDLSSGGAQRQLVNIAIELSLKGYNVEFLIYHDIQFYEEFLRLKGIKVSLIVEKNKIKRAIKMISHIRAGNFFAIISFLEGANFICSIAKLFSSRTKLVVSERSSNPNIFKSFKLKFYRYLHFIPNYVVANSHTNKKMISQINPFIPRKKLKVIYNAVDFEIWNKELLDQPQRKKRKFCILVASTHQYLKNFNNLIEAVNQLEPKHKSKLIIKWFGDNRNDGSFESGIKKIKEYGISKNFNLQNAVFDINIQMANADVIGLFSFYEGLPNAICEAMALAKPVLCSNISDMPMLLSEDQLVNPSNVLDIRNKLVQFLEASEDELRRLGEENYKIAIQRFNKHNIINEYLDLLC
jgi:glycosyltransferase involved in cell wall biosynthesis